VRIARLPFDANPDLLRFGVRALPIFIAKIVKHYHALTLVVGCLRLKFRDVFDTCDGEITVGTD
jgi:hypothetical protein